MSDTIFGPCDVCGRLTEWACSDCGIDSAGERIPHVCPTTDCRDAHEAKNRKSHPVTAEFSFYSAPKVEN